jgi:hypothetical protein
MKKFFTVLLLALITISAFAQGSSVIAPRQIPTEELRVKTFDNLVRSTYCALSTTQHVTPNDTSSTGTYSSAYLGTLQGPLKLRIQNLGTTGKIHFKEYALSGTNVASTSATDPYLQSIHGNYLATGTAGQLAPGEVIEMFYFGTPDLMFGGVEDATFSIQVYQPTPANY